MNTTNTTPGVFNFLKNAASKVKTAATDLIPGTPATTMGGRRRKSRRATKKQRKQRKSKRAASRKQRKQRKASRKQRKSRRSSRK